jgi:hypothetical protein
MIPNDFKIFIALLEHEEIKNNSKGIELTESEF